MKQIDQSGIATTCNPNNSRSSQLWNIESLISLVFRIVEWCIARHQEMKLKKTPTSIIVGEAGCYEQTYSGEGNEVQTELPQVTKHQIDDSQNKLKPKG